MPAVDKSEALFVGYSVKNRKFSGSFFKLAGEMARDHFSNIIVAILDYPYAFNDAARLGSQSPSAVDFARCLSIGDEREKMVRRVLSKIDGLEFEIRRWNTLDTPEALNLRHELAIAMQSDIVLRAELIRHAGIWMSAAHSGSPADFLGFQLSEIPILIDIYYRQRYLTDLYPATLNDFFQKLERGVWAGSLPLATRYAAGNRLATLTITRNDDEVGTARRNTTHQSTSHFGEREIWL
jgi:hypothetical protein